MRRAALALTAPAALALTAPAALALTAPAALALIVLAAACSSEPAPPPDAAELRERVAEAIRGDGDQVLHLTLLPASEGGTFEADREVWIDWSSDSVRRAYFGHGGDESPLTLIVGDDVYYPPSTSPQLFDGEVGDEVVEPFEAFFLPLLMLRLTEDTATVSAAEVDGAQVWRLEQDGVASEVSGNVDASCFDLQLDFDLRTHLPRAVAAADCGEPRQSPSRITAEWLDLDDLPNGFFDPQSTANFQDRS